MADTDHARWEEDLAAYALDALEPDERGELEAHLQGCARCTRDLDALRATVDLLPQSVERLAPPARLKRELMASVRADVAASAEPRLEGRRGRLRLPALPAMRPALAAGLAAAALAGGVGIGYLVSGEGPAAPTTLSAQATEAAPDGVHGAVIMTPDAAMVRIGGLEQPRPGHVYQAWLRHGDVLEPSSLVALDRSGEGITAIPHSVESFDEVLVTEEPAGGSEQPTSVPILTASLR